MRTFGLLSMTALILTGLPPTPIAPAPAPAAMQRGARIAPGEDPDARCAPFLRGFEEGDLDRARAAAAARPGQYARAARPRSRSRRSATPPHRLRLRRRRHPSSPQRDAARSPRSRSRRPAAGSRRRRARYVPSPENRERYDGEAVAAVQAVADAPVSTFSIDVDTGSYANVRRMLNAGTMPPQAAVRTEEMLNYFRYDYPAPQDRSRPFSVSTDMSGDAVERRYAAAARRPARLRSAARAPGRRRTSSSWSTCRDRWRRRTNCRSCNARWPCSPTGSTRATGSRSSSMPAPPAMVLEPTVEPRRDRRIAEESAGRRLDRGRAGIRLAYDVARRSMIDGGINRVILATDGDFNVGVTNNEALIDLVEREREAGITLTTLGFGTGNYNEAMMEQIADHGNGNYSYIDSPREAQKVLDDELASTLFTIAHDVKIQVEFNPAHVREYRLIGYENRALREEDFDNDPVDAGEIGAGHQVTALYEIVPADGRGWLPQRAFDANRREAGDDARRPGRRRWRIFGCATNCPGEDQSRLIEQSVGAGLIANARPAAGDTAFAAAVAAYGQLLRGDTRLNGFSFADARRLAAAGAGGNYWRREFIGLTELAQRHRFASADGGK